MHISNSFSNARKSRKIIPRLLQTMSIEQAALFRRNGAVVGNVQREAESGLIDHLGVLFTLGGYPTHAGRDSVSPPDEEYHGWPAVTAACCVMRRDLFTRFGGFDERFRNSYEDTDFCLKARAAGFQNYVANRSVIYHHVSASPGRKDNDVQNFALFWERWGDMISILIEAHQQLSDGPVSLIK